MGTRKGADTVALLTLVGTQMGQTVALGWRDPTILAAGLGSTAALLAVVETPGVSGFFGSRPLGPIGLAHAAAASVAGTAVGVMGPRIGRWGREILGRWRSAGAEQREPEDEEVASGQ